jgi:hypothetical protein
LFIGILLILEVSQHPTKSPTPILSLDNALVGKDDHPVVIDFGLAIDPRTGALRTHSGGLAGTPAYLAPELLAGTAPTKASDVYALGVMLFQALTGRLPFSANLLDRLRTDSHQPPTLPGVPRQLAAVCAQAMASRPQDRYPDANALSADLSRYLAREPVLAKRPWRLRRPLLATGLIGALLGMILLGWSWNNSRQPVHADPIIVNWIPLLDHPGVRNEARASLQVEILDRALAAYSEWSDREPENVYPRLQSARLVTLRADVLAENEPGTAAMFSAQVAARDAWKGLLTRQPNNLFLRASSVLAEFRASVRSGDKSSPTVIAELRHDCQAISEKWDESPSEMSRAIEQLGQAFTAWWLATPQNYRDGFRLEWEFARLQLACAANDPGDVGRLTENCFQRSESMTTLNRFCWRVQVLEAATPTLHPTRAKAYWQSQLDSPEAEIEAWPAFARQKYSAACFYLAELYDSPDGLQHIANAVKWARQAEDDRWLAVCLHEAGNRQEGLAAKTAFTEAVLIRRKLASSQPTIQHLLDLSASSFSLARWHEEARDHKAARELYREAHTAHSRACQSLPIGHPAHRWLADRQAALARIGQ